MVNWLYLWLGVIVVTLVIELISVGLTSIWLTGGGLVALLIYALGGPWWLQLVAFFVVTFVLIWFTRPWALKYLEGRKTATNYEEIIGKEVRVLEPVDDRMETGKAMYNGMEWTARAMVEGETFAVDEMARVAKVQGVKLMLVKKERIV
jgi:membrane protein implicated in regulation of membrane protease activity